MLNHVSMQGRLVRDPDYKYTPSGTPVCGFTVVWSETYKDKETTCFLNCNAWNKTAEFISNYFKKGDQIIVEGKLTSRDYIDNQGNKRYVTELLIDKVHFCGGKKDKEENTLEKDNQQIDGYIDITDDGDLPF